MTNSTNPVPNKASFNFSDIVAIFGAEQLLNISDDFIAIGVSTDSRTIVAGNIFIPLIGENFNAHNNIEEVLQKGAVCSLISSNYYEQNKDRLNNYPLIIVNDTLIALGEMAFYHRKRFSYPILAVAGSNGKTTTKAFVSHILSTQFNVLSTYGNYNNRVGVPLTLFQLSDEYNFAVIEIGTNEPGEINTLAKIVQPTQGIITNIGFEHLEKLIDIDGVEMEETSLIANLMKQRGFYFLNGDDSRLLNYRQLIDKNLIYGTNPEFPLCGTATMNEDLTSTIAFKGDEIDFSVQTNLIGNIGVINTIAATAVALHNKIDIEYIKSAVSSFQPLHSGGYARMSLEKVNGYTILNDCYNANPSSIESALNTISQMHTTGKKIAVLGDMRELGEATEDAHKEIYELALNLTNKVFTYGDDFAKVNNSTSYTNKTELINYLKSILQPNDIILIKGSRGTKMEEVVIGLR